MAFILRVPKGTDLSYTGSKDTAPLEHAWKGAVPRGKGPVYVDGKGAVCEIIKQGPSFMLKMNGKKHPLRREEPKRLTDAYAAEGHLPYAVKCAGRVLEVFTMEGTPDRKAPVPPLPERSNMNELIKKGMVTKSDLRGAFDLLDKCLVGKPTYDTEFRCPDWLQEEATLKSMGDQFVSSAKHLYASKHEVETKRPRQ